MIKVINCIVTDHDECASSPCDHMCTNHDGHYQCSCRDGYVLRNSRYCDGVSVCILATYMCVQLCNLHFVDIDECSSSPCGHICTNTAGSFVCTCREGYLLDSDGSTCTGMYSGMYYIHAFTIYSSRRNSTLQTVNYDYIILYRHL